MGYDAAEVRRMLGVCTRVALRLIRNFKDRGGQFYDLCAVLPSPPKLLRKFQPRLHVSSFNAMLAQMAGTTVPGRHDGCKLAQMNRLHRDQSAEQRKRDNALKQ